MKMWNSQIHNIVYYWDSLNVKIQIKRSILVLKMWVPNAWIPLSLLCVASFISITALSQDPQLGSVRVVFQVFLKPNPISYPPIFFLIDNLILLSLI